MIVRNYFRFNSLAVALFLLSIFCNAYPVVAQEAQSPIQNTAIQPNIIKFNSNFSLPALQHRPDTDLVELSGGKRIRLGQLRTLDKLSKKMKNTPDRHLMKDLQLKPAAIARVKITSAADLTAALKLQDNETIQLPSGDRYTVAQLRLAQTVVNKRLVLKPKQRVLPRGTIVKVTSKTNWKEIMKGPDSTILQSPNGNQITVAELKKTMAAWRPVSRRVVHPSGEGRQP